MLSKNKARLVISLQIKKHREEEGLYVVEGDKIVREFLNKGMPVTMLFARNEFISSLPADLLKRAGEIENVSYEELKKISTLTTPHNALAVVRINDTSAGDYDYLTGVSAALDFVQDPGNLGTIIRAAAWFGIKTILCSEECVDVYNPKVIQASMGALIHVRVRYLDLKEQLRSAAEKGVRIFGTVTEGKSIYSSALTERSAIILLGNESKGISGDLLPFVTDRIAIPKFTDAVEGIDSLNVGMAASIVFSEFARRKSGF